MSTHPDIHELIQSDIDGTASEADRRRLRDLLASNAEAREEHRRLEALKRLLANVPAEAPPDRLVARIMRAVRAERIRPVGGIFQKIFPSWASGRTALPYAYAAAAGVAIGIVGFHIVTGQGSFGTDAIERDAAATIGSAPVGTETARIVLEDGSVRGSAAVRKINGTLALDIDFPATAGFGVSVGYDPVALKFIGVSNRTGGIDRFQVSDGSIRWSASHPQRVTVFLTARTAAPSRVRVDFSAAGGEAGGGVLDLPGRE